MNKEELLEKTDIKINKKADCIYCGENFIITDLEEELLQKHRFKNPEHCPTCNFKILNSYFNDKHLYNRVDSQT
jgi:DNA-directed RNA polymerase subunit RPC12/RpoP